MSYWDSDDSSVGGSDGGRDDDVSGVDFSVANIGVIPTSHWDVSHGYSDFYRLIMRQIQGRLAELAGCVTNGVYISHAYDVNGFDGEDSDNEGEHDPDDIVLAKHDELLLPFWKAFTDRLRDAPDNVTDHIQIFNVQLTKDVYHMLTPAVTHKHINQLWLEHVDLGVEGLEFVARHVEDNPFLQELHLGNNPMGGLDISGCAPVLTRLFAAVKRHEQLKNLFVEACNIGNADQEFLRIMMDGCGNISHLDMCCNQIGPGGAHCIASALKNNPRWNTLVLHSNKMKDECIITLAHALGNNTNLNRISLQINDFTNAGLDALQRAIFDATSLNTVRDSNHNCHIGCEGFHSLNYVPAQLCNHLNQGLCECDPRLSPRMPYDQRIVIQSKLLYAVGAYDRGPLEIQYLAEVPLELMPNVLNFAQKTDDVPVQAQKIVLKGRISKEVPFKNVFEVFKKCVVPLLCVPKRKQHLLKRKRCSTD